MKQKAGKEKNLYFRRLKIISFLLLIFPSLILVLDIIDIEMVFRTNERSLWDNMPRLFRQSIFVTYPVMLLGSLAIFMLARKFKTGLDSIANLLFLLNGLVLMILVILGMIYLIKHL